MFGVYEDVFGTSGVGAGTFIILAVIAYMMFRAAPALLREVLPNFRIYPAIVGGIGFWWLIFSAEYLWAVVIGIAGIILTSVFGSSEVSSDES